MHSRRSFLSNSRILHILSIVNKDYAMKNSTRARRNSLRSVFTAVVLVACYFTFAFAASVLCGCSDGGYEEVNEDGNGGGAGNTAGAGPSKDPPVDLNPGNGSAGTGGSTTTSLVPFLDLQSFEGCKVSQKPQLAGLVRTANGLQYPFLGLDEDSELPADEKPSCTNCEFVWASPDPSDKGPITLAAYSNSGSIKYSAYLDKAKKQPVNVEFYTVTVEKFAYLQLFYQAIYNQPVSSQAVYDSAEWGKLVLDAWECQFQSSNNDCYLADQLKECGKADMVSLLNGLFSDALIGPEAFVNGGFCGHLQVVIKSRP